MVDSPNMSLTLGAEDSLIGLWQQDRSFDLLLREAPHHELVTSTHATLDLLLEGVASGDVDVAICLLSDLEPSHLQGLELSAILPRGAVEDLLIGAPSFEALEPGSLILASGPSRQAQVKLLAKGSLVHEAERNLNETLFRLDKGEVSAVVVPRWEVMALGYAHRESLVLSAEEFLPTPGQGVAVAVIRDDAATTRRLTAGMNNRATALVARAEFHLAGLMSEPVGVASELHGDRMELLGGALLPDGETWVTRTVTGAVTDEPELLGENLACELQDAVGR